jgi:hypothetical protein
VIEREQLGERAARGDADHVGGRKVSGPNVVGVEHTGRVRDEVGAGVAGMPRLVRDRAAGVAVVVADHEPSAVGEEPAEARFPPQHGRAEAHDEQHGRVVGSPKDSVHNSTPLHSTNNSGT